LKCYLFQRASRSLLNTGFLVAFRWLFARLFAFKDGQRRLQDGFWTRLRQFRFKMEPGRPKAPPRFSQDGSKALLRRPMTDPKSTKIHEKWVLRAIPILVSFFVRFSIDFQSIFRPPKHDFLFELYRFYSHFGLSGFVKIESIFECIFEPTWLGF
jgi:hypothetical protein